MATKNKKAALAPKIHPDHASNLHRVRRIKGQIEGIERMIEERRYCNDILSQVQAVSSALRSLSANILATHLTHCVTDAIESKNKSEARKRLDEITELFKRGY